MHWWKYGLGFPIITAAEGPIAPLCWGFAKMCALPKSADILQDRALDCT